MTTALCMNCGETKFGALPTCPRCGAGATGNLNLDIVFSDQRMSVGTLKQFGHVIQRLKDECDDDQLRFWAFISYVSEHHPDILTVEAPPELQKRITALLQTTSLPPVEAELKPPVEGEPGVTMTLPADLYQALMRSRPGRLMDAVQIRTRDGAVHSGMLLHLQEQGLLALDADSTVQPEEIVAIRPAAGWLSGWLTRPRWIEG